MTPADYLPFDIGSWRGEWVCPRHGMQHGGPAVQIAPRRDGVVITRRYCGMCLLALFDAVAGDGGGA